MEHVLSLALGSTLPQDRDDHHGAGFVRYESPEIFATTICMPNICTVDPLAEVASLHKLLGLLRDTSEINADGILAILDNDFEEKISAETTLQGNRKRNRKGTGIRGAQKALYNDPLLPLGGVDKMREKVMHINNYCINPANGGKYCQILLPDGHSGPCPRCGFPCSRMSDGKETFLSRDIVVRLEEHYKLLAKQSHSDLLQLICNHYPTAISRLSQHPADTQARVWCPLSGLIARKDFHNPEKRKGFLLDVEAKPNETAYLHGNEVKILEKHADKYVVLTTSNEKLEAPLEDVEKIGGHFPLVVVVFDDGAEVYKSLTTQYSNDSKTEVLVNIPEECCELN